MAGRNARPIVDLEETSLCRPRARSRQPLCVLAVAAAIGVALGEAFPVPWMAALCVIAGMAPFGWRFTWVPVPMAVAFFAAWHSSHLREGPGAAVREILGQERVLAEIRAVVVSEPRPTGGGSRFLCAVREADGLPPGFKAMATLAGEGWRYGDEFTARGWLRAPAAPRNPGQFDARRWLRSLDAACEFRVDRFAAPRVIGSGRGNPVVAWALAARDALRGLLAIGLENDPRERALIQSMVLGLQADADEELEAMFRETGTLHLFAVSGLNVAMFAGIVILVAAPFGISRRRAVWLAIPAVAGYAAVTGFASSCVRAAIMLGVALAGVALDRRGRPFNSLGAAAIAVLLWDSHQLFEAGFQLSFGVVAALMLLAEPIALRVRGPFVPDSFIPARLWTRAQKISARAAGVAAGFVGTNLAAWIGSVPLGLAHFSAVSPVAVLANLVAVPMAFVVLSLGVTSCSVGWCLPWVGSVFNHANWAVARGMIFFVERASALPFAQVFLAPPEFPGPDARLVVFDFGAGGAQVIETPGSVWCLDSGRARDAAGTLSTYLRRRGVNRLGGVVLSHGDAAHIGGAGILIREFAPGRIIFPPARDRSPTRRALAEACARAGIARAAAFAAREPLGPQATGELVFPPPGYRGRNADDAAGVWLLEIAGSRVLFLGDQTFRAAAWLREYRADLRADIAVVNIPGDGDPVPPDWLVEIGVRHLVVGHDPFRPGTWRGHFIEAVRGMAIRVWDQAETGAVTFAWSRDGMEVSPYLWGRPGYREIKGRHGPPASGGSGGR